MLAIIGTISSVLPLFLIAAFFITLTYWAIGVVYLAPSRELKRSESVTKSPIFGVFGEVLNGVSTIRAYGDSTRFAKALFALVDLNNRSVHFQARSPMLIANAAVKQPLLLALAGQSMALCARGHCWSHGDRCGDPVRLGRSPNGRRSRWIHHFFRHRFR